MKEALSGALQALGGEEFVNSLKNNSLHFFKEVLELSNVAVAWLVVHFEIKDHYKTYNSNIDALCYFSPERMAMDIMQPVLSTLFDRRKEEC